MYNSKYFLKKVDQVVKESTETYDLIYIDILNFSMFNKVFGDKKANEILMRLAERMRQMSEKEGICGRLFVDEFGILLPSRAYQESYLLDCIHEFQEKFSSSIYQMYMKVGVYRIKDANESSKEICVKAKLALDSIEGDYDKVLAYYDEKMLHDTIMKQKIIGEFNEALEDGQFCIYLQPQVTAEGKLLGAEALVRWQHPTEGMISPGLFIPVLEETSLITQLDCFVWEQAAKLLQEWKREGNDQIYISVNVSAMDFYFIDIYETMTQLVEKYEISPANLKIEITETVFMSDMKNQTKLLERLRAYGFEVELDDFGSGYSSLSMLKDIMVDVIKIDMGFLSKTAYEKRSWSILQSIMEMAQKLEIQTITEGVETKQQVNGLLDIGCRIFQGYYFEKPMQVEDFTKKYLAVSAF